MPNVILSGRAFGLFLGQYLIKSTWYRCWSYKSVNLYKYRRPLIISMPCYPYLLGVELVLSWANTIWSRADVCAHHINWPIYIYLGIILLSYVNYTHTCSLWIRSFKGQHHMKSIWYPSTAYHPVNLYTCRRTFIISMSCIPIPACCGSGPLIVPLQCIHIPASCGTIPFEGQNHKMSTWRQWRSYELVNLDTYGFPLIIQNGVYTHTCSLWIRSFRWAIPCKVDLLTVQII